VKFARKHIATGATLLVAVAAGHVVQNADRYFGKAPVQMQTAAVMPAPVAPYNMHGVTPLAATEATPAKADAASTVLRGLPGDVRALTNRLSQHEQNYRKPEVVQNLNKFGMPCETTLSATPAPGAMVTLALSATCHLSERVEFSQDRLRFAAMTNDTGALSVAVPALSDAPVFIVQFADGTLETTTATVPDTKEFERIALQWRGSDEMHIHAFEYGASYDALGHVWADAPHSPQTAVAGKGGFLISLGTPGIENPAQAEVYSYPRGAHANSGLVRINIETEVKSDNCNREISAETLQPGADGKLQEAEVTFAVPECAAVGEFLVLKNILRDLKIAQD